MKLWLPASSRNATFLCESDANIGLPLVLLNLGNRATNNEWAKAIPSSLLREPHT